MRNKNLKRFALMASVSAIAWFGASASAASLQDIFELSAEGNSVSGLVEVKFRKPSKPG